MRYRGAASRWKPPLRYLIRYIRCQAGVDPSDSARARQLARPAAHGRSLAEVGALKPWTAAGLKALGPNGRGDIYRMSPLPFQHLMSGEVWFRLQRGGL